MSQQKPPTAAVAATTTWASHHSHTHTHTLVCEHKLCVKKSTHMAIDTNTSAKNTRKKCCCHVAAAVACNSAFRCSSNTCTHTAHAHAHAHATHPQTQLFILFFAIHAKCV